MTEEDRRKELMGLLQGNAAATQFLLDLWRVFSLWDDLYDKDKTVSNQQLHDGFTRALINIPSNPFYRDNMGLILPVVLAAILNWEASNRLNAVGARDLAWFLRSRYVDVIGICAYVAGGTVESGVSAAVAQWLYLNQEEPLAAYQEGDGNG